MSQFPFQVYEILIVFVIALSGLAWFIARNPKREPSKLKMKAFSSSSHHTQAVEPHKSAKPSRPLNVNFEFENYTYDAYHVLGLPGGSSWESVQAAYKQSLSAKPEQGGEHSRECIQMAFEALKKALS